MTPREYYEQRVREVGYLDAEEIATEVEKDEDHPLRPHLDLDQMSCFRRDLARQIHDQYRKLQITIVQNTPTGPVRMAVQRFPPRAPQEDSRRRGSTTIDRLDRRDLAYLLAEAQTNLRAERRKVMLYGGTRKEFRTAMMQVLDED